MGEVFPRTERQMKRQIILFLVTGVVLFIALFRSVEEAIFGMLFVLFLDYLNKEMNK